MTRRAFSIDGRTFAFELSLGRAVPVGAYVRIDTDDGRAYLGQVLDEAVDPSRSGLAGAEPEALVRGTGALLAELDGSGSARFEGAAVFGDATIEPADDDVVANHLVGALGGGVGIEVGESQHVPGVPARLHAKGFGRHTFLCGQSGSGKTYTLGVILERLLLESDIRIVVVDPNSDYVNLATLRPQAETGLDDLEYRALTDRYARVAERIHVFGGPDSANRVRVRFGRLTTDQQSMVLGIDPIADSEIYNAFVRTVQAIGDDDYGIDDIIRATRSSFAEDQRRLGLRLENLGVADLSIWAGDDEPMAESLPPDAQLAVLDLGSVPSQREASIVAAAVLGRMWHGRHARRPTIIVVDEAHNLCPQNPTGPNQALATEHLIRIAGEGRKFGLYLLLATQRPDKVHENVLSQCDNLILMKMNSAGDIQSLSRTFSFVPGALVARAAGFGLGEGLAAGKIAPDPLLFRSGRRYTLEGGSDVPSTWAEQG